MTEFIDGGRSAAFMVWQLWALVAAMLAAALILGLIRRWWLARSGIVDIDRMSGRVFEEYPVTLFRREGYRVELTKFRGDYGGDLVIAMDGVRTVVQAKRWKRNVGVKAVQEVVAAKAMYDATAAMVVANSRYTEQAKLLARKNGVVLWDRDELASHLYKAGVKDNVERTRPCGAIEIAPGKDALDRPTVETCATCHKTLTPGERAYCSRNARRFAGRMLCFRHQRGASRART
jgi:restriction system protein